MVSKHCTEARVEELEKLAEGLYRIVYRSPVIARASRPGQFIQIRNWEGSQPLLCRPISIAWSDGKRDVEVLVKSVGEGTRKICAAAPGDAAALVGPLGKPFGGWQSDNDLWLLSGGIGVAPMVYLALEFLAAQKKKPVAKRRKAHFYFGARSADEMSSLARLRKGEKEGLIRLVFATEDGSAGFNGYITEALDSDLESGDFQVSGAMYSCGPIGMLKSLALLAGRRDFRAEGSLETQMGCGFGVCLGCSVEIESNDPLKRFQRVCSDGPVFDLSKVVWDGIL